MSIEFTIDLESSTVNVLLSALYTHAGQLAAREMERTGGRGFASGGISAQVQEAHRARALLLWMRVRTYEWRVDTEGNWWYIAGSDDLNYTLKNALSGKTRRAAKVPIPKAQRKDSKPFPWHEWNVVPMEDKPLKPLADWNQ